VGDSAVLTCPLKGAVTMLAWRASPKAGGPCSLVYRADRNQTESNCSDNMNLTFRAGLAPALEIQQPSRARLTPCISPCWCFAAPPRLSLYCDEQGSPVCEAAAGKPPAQLRWVPESSSTAEEQGHDNGTVTVLSRFTAVSTRVTNVTTCMVSHPAGNWSESIAC
ncbi:MOR1A protein, partial [Pteruthius melanotis]|nr:MOR1A protein [Pteruthius melanotis]